MSLFFGHATGDLVANKLFEQMTADKLPIGRLLTLNRDGPNVNKTVFQKLEGLIKEHDSDFNGFVDLGSCVLHMQFTTVTEKASKIMEKILTHCA